MLSHEDFEVFYLSTHLSFPGVFHLQEVLHWHSGFFFDVIVDLRLLQHQYGGQAGRVLENSKKANYALWQEIQVFAVVDFRQKFKNCIPHDSN